MQRIQGVIISQIRDLKNEYGEKNWNDAVEYFYKRHYRGMLWQWVQEDSNAARTTRFGILWVVVWIGKLILKLQWNVRMWGYMDRGFNENCITGNDIKPGLRMWMDSTCWDIVLDKGYSWWLRGDEWVLMWDTA